MLYNFATLSFIVLTIWLIVLTIAFWKMLSYYNKLTKGLTDQSLKSVLENLMKHANSAKNDIDHLKLYCDKIQKDGLLHIQKMGFLRFNPFKDTGGDQSFILSLQVFLTLFLRKTLMFKILQLHRQLLIRQVTL